MRLKTELETAQSALAEASTIAPEGSDELEQGNDEFLIHITCDFISSDNQHFSAHPLEITMTWDQIFSLLSPRLLNEASEEEIRGALSNHINTNITPILIEEYGARRISVGLSPNDFHTIKVQLRALGLITPGTKKRQAKDSGIKFWALTSYGDTIMNRLVARRRNSQKE